jgi:hypothetical protein
MKNEKQVYGGAILTKKDFSDLAEVNDPICISIYIPTSRAGKEVDGQYGQLKLKNSLKYLKQSLKGYGLTIKQAEDTLEPISDLLDDLHFWRNQSDCLVIFMNDQRLKYYAVPGDYEKLTYVSDHFYLIPLLSLFNDDGKFFLLNLSLSEVKFFEGTRNYITEVYVDDLVPAKLEEVVGYDYQNKSLQFRSGQGGEPGAMFHGQGAGKDNKDSEIEKFLRAVDKGLMKLLNDENAPLVLACVEHYYPVFERITDYAHLSNRLITGNHEETDPLLLHEMAWPLVEDLFQQERNEAVNALRDLSGTGKTSFDLNEIIPAALDGRIETLFIQRSTDRYGLYDRVNRTLIIDEKLKIRQASLYNMAAMQTWLKGGRVFLAGPRAMPFKETSINALFRY